MLELEFRPRVLPQNVKVFATPIYNAYGMIFFLLTLRRTFKGKGGLGSFLKFVLKGLFYYWQAPRLGEDPSKPIVTI